MPGSCVMMSGWDTATLVWTPSGHVLPQWVATSLAGGFPITERLKQEGKNEETCFSETEGL